MPTENKTKVVKKVATPSKKKQTKKPRLVSVIDATRDSNKKIYHGKD